MSAVLAESMAVSQHFMVWVCDSSKLSNWFLYYFLQHSKPLFERAATGSTIKTIGLPFFKALSIVAPALPEQKRIAETFCALDGLIAAQTEQLAALREHRSGLMQKLFPHLELSNA
jgi:type I restriction enzyme S subunit